MKYLLLSAMAPALLVGTAQAHPPKNANMSYAPWFRSLRQPGTGMSCCSIADCRQTSFRIKGNHYEALIDGTWKTVPPDRILSRTDNPTGEAVVCYTPYLGIMCFVKGPET